MSWFDEWREKREVKKQLKIIWKELEEKIKENKK